MENSDPKARLAEVGRRLEAEEGFDPMPEDKKTKPGETQVTLVSRVLGRKRAKVDRDGEAKA